MVITSQNSKLKNLHRKVCLSKKEVFKKLPVQKTGRTVPGLVTGCICWKVVTIKISHF